MDRTNRLLALLFLVVVFLQSAYGACPVERAPVKVAADGQAAQIRLSVMPGSIALLHGTPAPRPLPQDTRIAPAETTIYAVTATLVAYRLTPEAEIHLVLSDDAHRTIMAKIPAPVCAAGSRFLAEITNARTAFERMYVPADTFIEVRQPIEVQGVGFFDFFQGQRGLAPNGLSLYPVTAIDFTPAFRPSPPETPSRRRAVGAGGERSCRRPALTITSSRGSACSAEPVTISWQASDPAARVSIDGIGFALPASGSRTVPMSASTVYSGRATTSCGIGNEAVALVSVTPAATASLSGPSSVTTGNTTSLNVTLTGSSWTLSSSLGNLINPSTGTTSRSVSYTGNRSGTDTVTLVASGGGCGSIMRSHTIVVSSPPSFGLRCCDGTSSPSCFSCSNKRGCCSGHGGVCGCP